MRKLIPYLAIASLAITSCSPENSRRLIVTKSVNSVEYMDINRGLGCVFDSRNSSIKLTINNVAGIYRWDAGRRGSGNINRGSKYFNHFLEKYGTDCLQLDSLVGEHMKKNGIVFFPRGMLELEINN